MSEAVFIHSRELELSSYPQESPLRIQRAGRCREILDSMDLLKDELAPQPATRDEILEFHTGEYLDLLKKASDGVFDQSFCGPPHSPSVPQASPSLPRRLPAGMRQSSKTSSALASVRRPSLLWKRPMRKPGASAGSRKQLRLVEIGPLRSVRA